MFFLDIFKVINPKFLNVNVPFQDVNRSFLEVNLFQMSIGNFKTVDLQKQPWGHVRRGPNALP